VAFNCWIVSEFIFPMQWTTISVEVLSVVMFSWVTGKGFFAIVNRDYIPWAPTLPLSWLALILFDFAGHHPREDLIVRLGEFLQSFLGKGSKEWPLLTADEVTPAKDQHRPPKSLGSGSLQDEGVGVFTAAGPFFFEVTSFSGPLLTFSTIGVSAPFSCRNGNEGP
jgi:hypothetical protein